MSRPMLIEFAEVRRSAARSAASWNASFTRRWQSSKLPAHLQGMHVPAEGGELLFLQLADPSRRVEDDHVDVLAAVKRLGDGTARVPAGGHQDLDACVSRS